MCFRSKISFWNFNISELCEIWNGLSSSPGFWDVTLKQNRSLSYGPMSCSGGPNATSGSWKAPMFDSTLITHKRHSVTFYYIPCLLIQPIIKVFFFLFCFHSYNHWRDSFSGICLLGPVHQARNWILAGTFRFSLYICVKLVDVENYSFDSVCVPTESVKC